MTGLILSILVLQNEPTIDELLRRLSDEDIAVREDAHAQLVKKGEAIVPDLRKARKEADGEVATLLDAILDEILWWERTVWINGHAINVKTGTEIWGIQGSDLESVVVDRDVIVRLPDGRIERRALKDGALRWKASVHGRYGQLIRCGDLLIHAADTDLCALDAATGKETWAVSCNGHPQTQTRRLHGGDGLFLLGKNESALYEGRTGKKRWSVKGEGQAAGMLATGDVVLVTRTMVSRLAAADGKPVWSVSPGGDLGWRVWVAGERVVAGSGRWDDEATSHVYDVADGRELWKTSGYPVAALATADGLFVAACERDGGRVFKIDAKTGSELWKHPLREDGIDLRLDGGRLLLCEYAPISCGVGLRCLDVSTGEVVWKAKPEGVQVAHSEYLHSARIEVLPGTVVVIGEASGGDYVEAFGVEDGKPLSKWRNVRW